MALGTIQKVITCKPQALSFGSACGNNYVVVVQDAYVLNTSSQALFESSVLTDYTIPATFFGLAISVILTTWLSAKGFGFLLKMLK